MEDFFTGVKIGSYFLIKGSTLEHRDGLLYSVSCTESCCVDNYVRKTGPQEEYSIVIEEIILRIL